MNAPDVVTLGECLGLLTQRRPGRLAHVDSLGLGFGGAEGNVAIGVSRLGGRSAWIGRVGDDGLGDLITRELRAEAVDLYEVVDPDAPTALMIKERPRRGSTKVTYHRDGRAGSRITSEDLPDGLIESSGILHLTGITAGLGATALATLHAAIDRAHAAGVPVSFDVNHRSALWADPSEAARVYRGLASRAHVVFAGDDEAQLLTGAADPQEQMRAIHALGARTVAIKLGDRGAMASEDGDVLSADALPVEAVDTVGAGDAFVAGWLAETARGLDLAGRLATAIACGAVACTVEGDWEAAPTRADLASLTVDGGDPVQR
jgi:2-dehydro-3-deoxygluconokinase